jgi:hypothetical protein
MHQFMTLRISLLLLFSVQHANSFIYIKLYNCSYICISVVAIVRVLVLYSLCVVCPLVLV